MLQQKWRLVVGLVLSCAIASAVYLNDRRAAADYQAEMSLRQAQSVEVRLSGAYGEIQVATAFLQIARRALPFFHSFVSSLPQSESGKDAWLVAAELRPGSQSALTAWALTFQPSVAISDYVEGKPLLLRQLNTEAYRVGNPLSLPAAWAQAPPGVLLVSGGNTFESSGGGLWLAVATKPPQDVVADFGIERFILLRKLDLSSLRAAAKIAEDQEFNVSVHGADLGGALELGQPLASFGKLTEPYQIELGPYQFAVSVGPPNNAPIPRAWIAALIAGLALTGFWISWRTAGNLGVRSYKLGKELFTTSEELQLATRKEATFFQNVGTPHCEVDPKTGRFLRVNNAMCNWLGYDREELLSKTTFDVSILEDRETLKVAVAQSVNQGGQQIQMEKRYLTRSGDMVWGLVTSDLFTYSDGASVFLSTIIDITERKAQEQMRGILLRELHHRVGNTMQLIDSLVRQSRDGARSIDGFSHTVRQRLAAVASAQSLLFKTGWQTANLQDIAKSVLKPFDRGNVEISLPNVPLPTQHAQTFALAVHELATASLREGALKTGKQPVSLTGTMSTNGEGEKILTLVWKEGGKGLARRQPKSGFGHSLLTIALPRQFDGEATTIASAAGYEYHAELKLPQTD